MKPVPLSAALVSLPLLSACVVDAPPPVTEPVVVAPLGMEPKCIAQASRMTGLPPNAGLIAVTRTIMTGGGPLVILSVDGVPYSCRTNADGTVTVFSEYAN